MDDAEREDLAQVESTEKAKSDTKAGVGCLVMLVVALIAVVVGVVVAIGGGDDEADGRVRVGRDLAQVLEYRWPLTTVDGGWLSCEAGAVTIEVVDDSSPYDGKIFAVNGLAEGRQSRRGWLDIDLIWAANTDPATSAYQPKINIGDLISRGNRICDEG